MSIKHLNTKGDTIVEVLIAIAIVSAVLGGAFVSANRSLNGTRQAQERGEAVKLVESQLERLKAAAKTTDVGNPVKNIFAASGPNPFCLDDSLNRVAAGNALCTQGAPARYVLSIQRAADNSTFTATANWDAAGGAGPETIRIVYRLHQ